MQNNIIKILFLGDITGKSGRNIVKLALSKAIDEHDINFVIANVENAANSTNGIDYKSMLMLSELNIDVMTLGNHFVHCDKRVLNYKCIVRPINVKSSVGIGEIVKNLDNCKIKVISVLGCLDMNMCVSNPIEAVRQASKNNECITIVDYHASSPREKLVACHCLRQNICALIGTHTHVPSNDCRIVGGIAFQTDAGLSGNMLLGSGKNNKIYSKIFYDSNDECPGSYYGCNDYSAMTGCVIEVDISSKKATNIYSVVYSKYLSEGNKNY